MPERAVEPALAQQLARLAERAALGQRADEHLGRAAAEHVDVVVDEVEREPGVVLGLGDAAGAQRVLGRVPLGRHAQAQRAARQRHVAHARRSPRRPAGRRSPPGTRAQSDVGAAPVRLLEQQAVVERLARHRRPDRRRRRAELGPDPRPVREDHAPEQRVVVAGQIDRRHAPRALGVALGEDQQRVERRGLDGEPDRPGRSRPRAPARRRSPGPSSPASTRFSAARRVSTSIRHSRSSTSRSASRRRRRESGSPASKATVPSRASMRPRSSPGARSCSARSR